MVSSQISTYVVELFRSKRSSGAFIEVALSLGILVLTLFLLGGSKGFWQKRKDFAKKRKDLQRLTALVNKFPGFEKYPILGSVPKLYHLLFNPCRDFLPWLEATSIKYGPIFRFWNFDQPKLSISCPETAIKLMQHEHTQAKTTEVYSMVKNAVGNGLVTIPHEQHSSRKKMWLQGLTKRNIEQSGKLFNQEALKLCKDLEQYSKTGEEFDLMAHSILCTFRTIASTALGIEYMQSIPEQVAKNHIKALHTVSVNLFTRGFQPWLKSDWIYYNLTKKGRQTRQCIQSGNKLSTEAILTRKMLRIDFENPVKERFPCFLDILIDFQEQGLLSNKEVMEDLNAFIVTGYDTSGIAILNVLYYLAVHPECQDKCVNELLKIFGGDLAVDSQVNVTPEQVRKIKYLEMCIRESLRLSPIVPVSFRQTTQDVMLPDGRIIPKGVDMYFNIQSIHKSAKYFPEPDKFRPERHLAPIPAQVPFALGSRGCIGQVYAMQELKIILAHLLLNYKWTTTEKTEVKRSFQAVLVPENGVHFKITKRTF